MTPLTVVFCPWPQVAAGRSTRSPTRNTSEKVFPKELSAPQPATVALVPGVSKVAISAEVIGLIVETSVTGEARVSTATSFSPVAML